MSYVKEDKGQEEKDYDKEDQKYFTKFSQTWLA